ncbi:MAG: type VI secretion system protein TssA [Gammaproteobacteria bacterium]|nr:type VI secretion system protein TssA [Gammaproteobacteria bacterium]
MATEATFDIDALLQPVSEDKPQGVDIREDYSPTSIYYQIKDARAQARTAERQNMMSDDPEAIYQTVTEWQTVLRLAPQILTEYGKDFEITAWYIEALVREYGFAGLRDGFILARLLAEKFWDELYPLPDEDGLESRVAPIAGLNGEDGDGTLIGPIKQIGLTQAYNALPFAAWHYEQAYDIETITDPEKKEARISSGAVTLKMIEQAILETPPSFFANLKDDIEACVEEYRKLVEILDAKCGDETPPSSNIRKTINRVLEIFGFLTKNVIFGDQVDADEEDVIEAGGQGGGGAVTQTSSGGSKGVSIENVAIANRDEAFRALLKVSEFFRRTEPHSPISYNLEQAVKWGKMSLPELLSELITDERAREDFFKLTGIPVNTDS